MESVNIKNAIPPSPNLLRVRFRSRILAKMVEENKKQEFWNYLTTEKNQALRAWNHCAAPCRRQIRHSQFTEFLV
jgi:hypothetical protein